MLSINRIANTKKYDKAKEKAIRHNKKLFAKEIKKCLNNEDYQGVVNYTQKLQKLIKNLDEGVFPLNKLENECKKEMC